MASEYLFLSGSISALESELLTRDQITRMIDAETVEKSFGVFYETPYGKFVDNKNESHEFFDILQKIISEKKNFILEAGNHTEEIRTIFAGFDLNNLKCLLKYKYTSENFDVETITLSNDDGFSVFGEYDLLTLKKIIFERIYPETFSSFYKEVLLKVDEIFKENGIEGLETSLDAAYLQMMQKFAKTNKSEFFIRFLKQEIDLKNIEILFRKFVLQTFDYDQEDYDFFEGGALDLNVFSAVNDLDELVSFLTHNNSFGWFFKPLNHDLLRYRQKEITLDVLVSSFESAVYEIKKNFLKETLNNGGEGIEVALLYFYRLLTDMKVVKTILFGKTYNMSNDDILKLVNSIL